MADPIRTIVAGVAAPGRNDPVLRQALDLGRRLGATVHLVHSYLPPPSALALGGAGVELAGAAAVPVLGGGEMADLAAALEARLRAEGEAAATGARVQYHVVPGPAHAALVEVAEETGAELVLVGATHRGGLERFFLGTTAGRTLRQSRAPVLVLRQPLPAGEPRVLLTTDLSELSAAACARAIETTSRLFAASTPRFRCLLVAGIVHGDLPPGEEEGERARRELADFVAALPVGSATLEPVVRLGVPVDEMAAEAAEWPAHLVVLGTHGRTGLSHLFLGSVAETAVRDIPCTALVIPAAAGGAGGSLP